MVPTSWRVQEGGGAMALMPRCYAARTGLVRLVGRLLVGMGALSDTAALGNRGTSVLERCCTVGDQPLIGRELRTKVLREATASARVGLIVQDAVTQQNEVLACGARHRTARFVAYTCTEQGNRYSSPLVH